MKPSVQSELAASWNLSLSRSPSGPAMLRRDSTGFDRIWPDSTRIGIPNLHLTLNKADLQWSRNCWESCAGPRTIKCDLYFFLPIFETASERGDAKNVNIWYTIQSSGNSENSWNLGKWHIGAKIACIQHEKIWFFFVFTSMNYFIPRKLTV